jgi:hypothetical protein
LLTGITTSTHNWWAKATLLVGAMLTVLACQEPGEIGLTPTTPVGVFLSDTFTISRSTILLDSVQSSGLSGMLIGRHSDPTFGKIRATSFARLNIQSQFQAFESGTTNTIPASKVVYDSTKIFVAYGSGYYLGDTTVTQTWGVHRLTEDIKTTNYDIRNTVGYEAQPIVRFTFKPRPFSGDSTVLTARLPDAIGRELFSQYGTDAGRDATKFQDLNIKGFAFVATAPERAAVLQLLTASTVRLYYHVEGETAARSQDFFMGGSHFTNLTTDRTGTPLANLRAGQALAASATNGRTYIQPFTGVTTKLQFPTLLSLEQSRRVAINRADLVITPTQPTNAAPSSYSFVPYIALSEANGFQLARTTPNRIVKLVPGFPGTAINTNESSFFNPQVVTYNTRTKGFTVNMTGYIQSVMAGVSPNSGLLLLTPGNPSVAPVSATTGVLSPAFQWLYLSSN